jgi:hypothetical protein
LVAALFCSCSWNWVSAFCAGTIMFWGLGNVCRIGGAAH